MATDLDKYHDLDDLGLYLTIIEKTSIIFNPTRTIQFNIIRPFDRSEKTLRYKKGVLTFRNIYQCSLDLTNEFYEYPEFYRSAILEESKLLQDTYARLEGLDKKIENKLRHFYLYIDQGNKETEVHIICESHEMQLETEARLLTDFEGLGE